MAKHESGEEVRGQFMNGCAEYKKHSCHMGPQTKQFDYGASCSGFLDVSSLGL